MAQSTSSVVANHILTEIMAQNALQPLYSRSNVVQQLMNRSNIDGQPSTVRKIPKRTAFGLPASDTEGATVSTFESLAYATTISLTPSGYVLAVQLTMKAIRRRLPGATYEQVMQAINSGTIEGLAIIRDVVVSLQDSFSRRVETSAAALFSSASESAGTTTVNLSIATCLDAMVKLYDNVPEHDNLAFVFDAVGMGDLRSGLTSGSGSSLAALLGGNQADLSLFNAVPDLSRTGFRNSLFGVAVFEADKNNMATANAAADRVGALLCVGAGETGAPGSLRGAGEICLGHDLQISSRYEPSNDTVNFFGRMELAVAEHTDEHYVQIIYGIT